MRDAGVPVNDLHALASQRPALQLPHNVHFTPAGCEALADQVAAVVAAQLTH
jgi:lysophospholipase L1-like esterase